MSRVIPPLEPLVVTAAALSEARMDKVRADVLNEVAMSGKYPKLKAGFLPIALLPPLTWFYECSTCYFYRYPHVCVAVAGEVQPYSYCLLWTPEVGERPFGWVKKVVEYR